MNAFKIENKASWLPRSWFGKEQGCIDCVLHSWKTHGSPICSWCLGCPSSNGRWSGQLFRTTDTNGRSVTYFDLHDLLVSTTGVRMASCYSRVGFRMSGMCGGVGAGGWEGWVVNVRSEWRSSDNRPRKTVRIRFEKALFKHISRNSCLCSQWCGPVRWTARNNLCRKLRSCSLGEC